VIVDIRPAQNRGGSPAWASDVRVKKGFASAIDQKIQNIILKLDFYSQMPQKRWHIARSVLFFYPPPTTET